MKKQVNELSLERAKVLFGKEIKEEKLKRMLERIKAFCKVAYQLYLTKGKPDKPIAQVRQLNSEPPNEFTKAA